MHKPNYAGNPAVTKIILSAAPLLLLALAFIAFPPAACALDTKGRDKTPGEKIKFRVIIGDVAKVDPMANRAS